MPYFVLPGESLRLYGSKETLAADLQITKQRAVLQSNDPCNVALAGSRSILQFMVQQEEDHVQLEAPNDTICLWVELNMHRPDFERSFRPNSVMMFGETFHCAALVALDRRFGVNVVLGKANRILGDK